MLFLFVITAVVVYTQSINTITCNEAVDGYSHYDRNETYLFTLDANTTYIGFFDTCNLDTTASLQLSIFTTNNNNFIKLLIKIQIVQI